MGSLYIAQYPPTKSKHFTDTYITTHLPPTLQTYWKMFENIAGLLIHNINLKLEILFTDSICEHYPELSVKPAVQLNQFPRFSTDTEGGEILL